MKPKIAILGSGPGALCILQACREIGILPHIYTGDTSLVRYPLGAFWFHDVPKSLHSAHNLPKQRIISIGYGTGERYSAKLWGMPFPSSFPKGIRFERGWAPAPVMEVLKPTSSLPLTFRRFTSDREIWELAEGYDAVFQTFPTFFERNRRNLRTAEVYIFTRRFTDLGFGACLYNGTGEGSWLRETYAFGSAWVESTTITAPKGYHLMGKRKKLHPDTRPTNYSGRKNIYLIGRFAEWKPKMLAHESYLAAQTILNLRGYGPISSSST